MELSFSTIAPPGSVDHVKFHQDIPCTAAATVIQPLEVLPDYADLQPITSTWDEAFQQGMRSFIVSYKYQGQDYIHNYHFSKVGSLNSCYKPVINY
jgi:hypothetical protein